VAAWLSGSVLVSINEVIYAGHG